MASFSAILDTQMSEVERPKPIPVGHYIAMVDGRYKQDVSAQKQTPYVEFQMKLIKALDDVDADDLKAALTKPSGQSTPLNAKSLRNTYYLTEDSLFRLKDFLEDLGLDVNGKTFSELLDETAGCLGHAFRAVVILFRRTSSVAIIVYAAPKTFCALCRLAGLPV